MNKTKKPLPYSVSKAELVDLYIDQKPEVIILAQMNKILVADGFSIHSKRIEHNQFMQYVKIYNLPCGYWITDDD